MSKETGGPAFPVTPADKSGQIAPTFEGMTLRDYFAAQVVGSVLLAALDGSIKVTQPMTEAVLADQAYAIADAMLAERDK